MEKRNNRSLTGTAWDNGGQRGLVVIYWPSARRSVKKEDISSAYCQRLRSLRHIWQLFAGNRYLIYFF